MKRIIGYLIFLCVGVVITAVLAFQYFNPQKTHKKTFRVDTPNAKINTAKTDSRLRQTPTPVKLAKNMYVVAAFGDSMIDTMGEKMEILQGALQVKYPGVTFKLYNYGLGATNVEQGLSRWSSSFVNRERSYPPIGSIQPDVIILGSYSYNPFYPQDLNKRRMLLAQLIQKAKDTGARVYLLAEIAPLYDGFGEGPKGPNMGTESAHLQANKILEQLEDVSGIAGAERVGLIDVFHLTQVSGKYGNRYYTNPDDGIHPSEYGQKLTAEQIVKEVKFE